MAILFPAVGKALGSPWNLQPVLYWRNPSPGTAVHTRGRAWSDSSLAELGDLGREDEALGSQDAAGLPQWQGRAVQRAEGHPSRFTSASQNRLSKETGGGGETRCLVAESPVAEDMRN